MAPRDRTIPSTSSPVHSSESEENSTHNKHSPPTTFQPEPDQDEKLQELLPLSLFTSEDQNFTTVKAQEKVKTANPDVFEDRVLALETPSTLSAELNEQGPEADGESDGFPSTVISQGAPRQSIPASSKSESVKHTSSIPHSVLQKCNTTNNTTIPTSSPLASTSKLLPSTQESMAASPFVNGNTKNSIVEARDGARTPPEANTNVEIASSPLAPTSGPGNATTPAKRRRKDMASSINSTLRKPFKSPMKVDRSPVSTRTLNFAAQMTSSNPINSSPIKGKKIDDEEDGEEEEIEPLARSVQATIPSFRRVKNSNPPFRSSLASSGSPSIRAKTGTLEVTKTKDPELHALQQQHTRLLASVRAAKTAFDNATQAYKIEQSGEDDRLEALIVKWRGAAQQAADHMFGQAADRVNRMGGPAALREMQERGNKGGGWGFSDDRSGFNDQGDDDDDERRKRRKEMYEAEYDMDELRMLQAKEDEEAPSKTGAGSDDERFTMAMMLKTLNIEPHIIGYDTELLRWAA